MQLSRSKTAGSLIAMAAAAGLWATSLHAQTIADRPNHGVVEILAGGIEGSSIRIAQDLADVLDDGTTRRVLPVIGQGALQNLADLKALRGVDLVITQTDVLDYARRQRLYPGNESAVTYVTKLYDEEVHLLARPEINSIADLAEKKVNLGPQSGGTWVTGTRLFELLKIKIAATAFRPGLALEKLKAGEIAALVYVTAKPAPLFAAAAPQQLGLHFLGIPLTPEIASAYIPASLSAEDYPSLIKTPDPINTVAVGAVLLAANLTQEAERYRNLANFVEAFFGQFSKFREAPNHPKWREVNLAAELPGWRRFPPAEAWLKRNAPPPATIGLSDSQLREAFLKFLDEYSRSSGQTVTAQEKGALFEQFKRWQGSQSR